jgi:hypothetical protein
LAVTGITTWLTAVPLGVQHEGAEGTELSAVVDEPLDGECAGHPAGALGGALDRNREARAGRRRLRERRHGRHDEHQSGEHERKGLLQLHLPLLDQQTIL